jgi:cytochrome c oxidase cbb3-type subunit IV
MIPGIVTALLLTAFLGGCLWVFSPRRRAEFAEAEQLALDDAGTCADAGGDAASPVIHSSGISS